MKRVNPVALLLLAVALLTSSAGIHAKTFKIATLAPAGSLWLKEVKKGAQRISELTQGRVKLKFYPGGVMGNQLSVHRKIKAGQLHGGAFGSAGLAHLYPDIQLLNLPMLFDSFAEVDHVRAIIEPEMKRNMEVKGFVLLGVAEGGFARIMSKSPMRSLDQIRNSKLWAPEGDVMVQVTYDTMGLSPISLPVSDVFTSLKTGLIETLAINPSSAIAFQWHNDTAYVTDTPLIYLVALLAIEKKSFDEISVDDQRIVREEFVRVVTKMDEITRRDNLRAGEMLKDLGMEFVSPDKQELELWKKLSAQSIERLIEKGAVSREGVERITGILQAYREQQ